MAKYTGKNTEVSDDIYYEISTVQNYIDYLNGEIKRLKIIEGYYSKMINSKRDKDKNYFLEGINLLLTDGETVENFQDIFEDYKTALNNKLEQIDKLENEIKIIKKLKV